MPALSILMVEDDPLARRVMASRLQGHRVSAAASADEARPLLEKERFDLAFIDLELGDGREASGLELIPLAARRGVYAVVMSGHDSEPVVERAYALGCRDFYGKGRESGAVESVLARFLDRRDADPEELFRERWVTADPATRASVLEALRYAPSELPILLLGPSGTGKTSLARVVHERSRRSGEFVAVNCSAYTDDLLEAELFGYRKGAFTGAGDGRKGKLLTAHRGTLFLDEIGSMSLKMQAKLLKAIEERTFHPLGSDRAESSDFRVVSATLEDVQGLVRSGRLRFDFFQRVHGFALTLKPLQERPCDVIPLIAAFTAGGKRLSFTPEARARLLAHDWPGNVRELKKLVDLLAAGHEGRVDLPALERLLAATRVAEGASAFDVEEPYRFAKEHGLEAAVDRFVDLLVERSLAANGGVKTKALSELKISTRLLYSSLRRRPGGRA